MRLSSSLFVLIALGSAPAACAQSVSTPAQLKNALDHASSGTVIRLAGGAFGAVEIRGFHGQASLVSADPSHRAVLNGLRIDDSSGLTLDDLELEAPLGSPDSSPFSITGSDRIVLQRLEVHSAPGGALSTEGTGLLVRDSQHVTIADSDLHDLHHGIAHVADSFLEIRGNHLHDLFDDGIRGGGSSNVIIDHNRCDSQHPLASDADHPDCIQFWTSGYSQSAHDIAITNNSYERGHGLDAQGIFLADETGHTPYERVTITGNVIRGAMYNGIFVEDARALSLTDNLVCGYPDRISWILVRGAHGARIERNIAQRVTLQDDADTREVGDKLRGACRPGEAPGR